MMLMDARQNDRYKDQASTADLNVLFLYEREKQIFNSLHHLLESRICKEKRDKRRSPNKGQKEKRNRSTKKNTDRSN